MAETSVTFENPMGDDDLEAPRRPRPLNSSWMSTKDFSTVDGENATIEQVIAVFRRVAGDEDTIDREGLATVMLTLNKPSDEAAIDGMVSEIEARSPWDTGDRISLEMFVPWYQNTGAFVVAQEKHSDFKDAGSTAASAAKTVLKPATKIKNAITGGGGDDDDREVRGVAPESMFLIDKSGNTEMRERADLAAKVHARYERDFHHLQDILLGQENDSNYQEAFDRANEELFDEATAVKKLGYPAECVKAAKGVFQRKEQENLWRHFLQSEPLAGTNKSIKVRAVLLFRSRSTQTPSFVFIYEAPRLPGAP